MRKLCVIGVALVFVAASAGSALAAGFAIIEQSVKGLGTAFSGGAASADDPSTVYFNPAGMTRLDGQQASVGMHYIIPSAEFEGTATNVVGAPISGGDGGQGGVDKVVPNAYYTLSLGDQWVVGLGINAPFGLSTKYDPTWMGRYHAIESDVMTVNLNPAVAYQVNDQLSVGAGVNAQYIDATLSSMVDFGLLALPPAGSGLGDVFSEVKADDWSYGYNLGVLYQFNEDSRVGVSYRSEIKHELDGDATFNFDYVLNPAFLPAAQATFTDQGASGDITLPASAQLSAYHRFNDAWAIMADVMWTDWSAFDKLQIDFDGTLSTSPSVTTENWEDSWRYSLGATFNPSEQLTLRGGVAYDESPIPDEYRTPRIPGNNRLWLALGAGYAFNAWQVDCAYAHLFVDDGDISLVDTGSGRGNLDGTFDNSVDIVSVEASYKF